jgi:NNP family nitrate/nitrite transporter-like MFS transporter
VGAVCQAIVPLGLSAAWRFGVHGFGATLALGALLGVAGASFAVALPLASRWYPPEHQGTALGIAGAGNSGTVLAALFAPSLAAWAGWNNVFGLLCVPLGLTLAVYLLCAKDSPTAPRSRRLSDYASVLKTSDAWWFMFFYSVTFGGFVGLASSLTIYFNDQYGLPAVVAGYFTAACVFAGSLVRPLGGSIADRLGGTRTLSIMYCIAATALVLVSSGLPGARTALLAFIPAMLALGAGNGAIFQLVPQRFGSEVGVITGAVGCAGGLGGFYLASSLGYSKQLTGSYQAGFLVFAALAALALLALTGVKRRWRTTWSAALAGAARI